MPFAQIHWHAATTDLIVAKKFAKNNLYFAQVPSHQNFVLHDNDLACAGLYISVF